MCYIVLCLILYNNIVNYRKFCSYYWINRNRKQKPFSITFYWCVNLIWTRRIQTVIAHFVPAIPLAPTHTKVLVPLLRCKLCRCKSLWRWRLIQSSKVWSRSFGYRHYVAELAAYPMCLQNTTDQTHVVHVFLRFCVLFSGLTSDDEITNCDLTLRDYTKAKLENNCVFSN